MPPKWNPRYQNKKRVQGKFNSGFYSRQQKNRSNYSSHQDDFYEQFPEITDDNISRTNVAPTFNQMDPITSRSLKNYGNAYNFSQDNINQSMVNIQPNSINGLRKVSELPDRFRSLFPFGVFNSIQSQCIDTALYGNEDLVVIAPTGSGKTVVFELAMINVLMNDNDHARMVYIAPTKAICSGRAQDWSRKFQHIGITCGELTGDTNTANIADIKKSNIIVTTPEKWESVTRQWVDIKNLLSMLKLFMIDEVHILHEDRGAILEAVVSRMKLMGTNSRFIAISATVPNIEDVASWINLGFQNYNKFPQNNVKILQFGDEYRPVRLSRQVLSYPSDGNVFKFDKTLNDKLLDIIQQYSNGKPTMVFCATRKSTEDACQTIVKQLKHMRKNLPWNIRPVEMTFHDKLLPGIHVSLDLEIIKYGVVFHHAGLHMQDRKNIESMFLQGAVHVICATSTLAIGVNLPAHLVIIKSTMAYKNGSFTEYSDSEIKQMLGRAGRPQFDDSGVAVIMTSHNMKQKYEELVTGVKDRLESSLHETLHEHLNSEICLGTIDHVNNAMKWMKSNPQRYDPGFKEGQNWEKRLEGKFMLIEIGETMAKYHIKYLTMQRILSIFSWCQKNSTSSKEEIRNICLQKVSQAEEFNEVKLHRHEKLALNKLNQHADIKFPLSGKVKDTKEKVFIMIQVGNVPLEDSSTRIQFNTESRVIIQHSHRILKCLVELAAYKENVTILKIAMDLVRCMKAKMWNDSPLLLKQLDGIGEQYAKKLLDAGITNFEQLKECEPWKIETACNRYPPFGHNVHETVSILPSLKLDIERSSSNSPEYQIYVVNICLSNKEKVSVKRNGMNLNAAFIAATDDLLIEFRQVPLWKIQQGLKFHFKTNIQPNQPITCSVLPEEF
ncbi:14476_t:CDS:10, partial [Gigaspora rosea]